MPKLLIPCREVREGDTITLIMPEGHERPTGVVHGVEVKVYFSGDYAYRYSINPDELVEVERRHVD